MASDIILFKKKEKFDLYIFAIESIEKKLFTSKNDIQQLKNHLKNYNHEKVHFAKQIEKITLAAKALNPMQVKDISITSSTNQEKRLQIEQSLNEIHLQMKKFLVNEHTLTRELKNKDETIKHLNTLKKSYLQEMADYGQTIHLYERSTEHLSRALEDSKQLIKEALLEEEKKTQDIVNSFEEKQSQFINKIEKQEQSLLKYQQLEAILYQKLQDKNQYIHSLRQEVNELKENIKERNQEIRIMEQKIQQMSQNLVESIDQKPKQERLEMNTIKKGSWLRMAWHLWSNESEVQYLEKIEQLNSTIKDLQQGLKYYESLLEKMNVHFQRYEEDKAEYIHEVKKINDDLQIQKDNEQQYLNKIGELNSTLEQYREQDNTYKKQNEAMKETIKEMQQREKEYQSQLEKMKLKSIEQTQQLKKTIRSFQEKEKQYREQFQTTSNYPRSKPENKQPNNQVRPNAQKKANNQTKKSTMQQQQQSRYDMLKQYYPQANSRQSVFNPFKNS